MPTRNSDESSFGYILVLGAGITFSLTAVLTSLLTRMGISSLEQAFFRISVTALFFGLVLFFRRPLRKVRKGDIKFFVVNGLFGVSLSVIAYLSSIAVGTPVAIAVTLSYLQPMFSVLLARFFLKEGITPVKIFALVASILGASIVSGLWQIFGAVTSVSVVGVLLATMNGFFYSVYIIIGRLSGSIKSYHFATTMFYSFLFGTLWAGPLWLLMSVLVKEPIVAGFSLNIPVDAWILIILMIFAATVTPYGLLAMGLKKVKASIAGIVLLVEPLSVMLMGVLILNQPLTPWDIAGAALILSATILVSLEERMGRFISTKRGSKEKG